MPKGVSGINEGLVRGAERVGGVPRCVEEGGGRVEGRSARSASAAAG